MGDSEPVMVRGSTPLVRAAERARSEALQTRLDSAALRARLGLADGKARGDLSPREAQALRLLSQGLTTKQIAGRLEVSDNTVKYHLNNVYRKLRVHSRVQAANAFKAASSRPSHLGELPLRFATPLGPEV